MRIADLPGRFAVISGDGIAALDVERASAGRFPGSAIDPPGVAGVRDMAERRRRGYPPDPGPVFYRGHRADILAEAGALGDHPTLLRNEGP